MAFSKQDITICETCHRSYIGAFHEQCPHCGDNGTSTVAVQGVQTVHSDALNKAQIQNKFDDGDLLTLAEYTALSPNSVSNEEYQRYCQLWSYQDNGTITALELQPKYELIPTMTLYPNEWISTKRTQSAVSYTPDFRYQYGGITIVEEYKAITSTATGKAKPRLQGASRERIKLWQDKHRHQLKIDALRFVIVGWYRKGKRYIAFDSNGNRLTSYPLL